MPQPIFLCSIALSIRVCGGEITETGEVWGGVDEENNIIGLWNREVAVKGKENCYFKLT
jgi:hypothetical protein